MKLPVLKRYGTTLMTLLAIAFFSAVLPPNLSWLLIIPFIAFMVFTMGRGAVRTAKQILEVSKGRKLLEYGREELDEVKKYDPFLLEDLRKQTTILLVSLVPLAVIFLYFYLVNTLGVIAHLMKSFTSALDNEILGKFLTYLVIYGTMFLISVTISTLSMRRVAKEGTLLIPSKYVITTSGIVIDDRFSLSFPLQCDVVVISRRRRFVELHVKSAATFGMQTKQRIRLYAKRPDDLWNLLSKYVMVGNVVKSG
ncbi:MAG: hypothetical protein DRJ40_06440 [Thermoprotei archaeon]|nr:MAG: hypothetical protein DRJ40_06440 [Thermoprotei archaeon]